MEVVPKTGTLTTREEFGDCQLHIEWASPAEVKGDSQGRGNSGVFFFGMYEVQVLDSYDNVTYADGQAAALYGQYPPEVNACRAPGEFQSYDLFFRAPRWGADGTLTSPAVVTVVHNGVLVHHAREMVGRTAHRAVGKYAPPRRAGRHHPAGPREPRALPQHLGAPVRALMPPGAGLLGRAGGWTRARCRGTGVRWLDATRALHTRSRLPGVLRFGGHRVGGGGPRTTCSTRATGTCPGPP